MGNSVPAWKVGDDRRQGSEGDENEQPNVAPRSNETLTYRCQRSEKGACRVRSRQRISPSTKKINCSRREHAQRRGL